MTWAARRARRPRQGRPGDPSGGCLDEPPLRLILGSEAYAYATAAATARSEPDAAWHLLTVTADRDGATSADRDPLSAARS
ncbi:MAG TPA: hypothetical protein VHF26_07130 [Trebonia sp.]|nr:hypothetical protein [Trebonia sp.]